MPFLILIAFAAGIFYLIVLPILVFIALGRAKEAERKVASLRDQLLELRAQKPQTLAVKQAAPAAPRETSDYAYMPHESAAPKAAPRGPGITPPDIPVSAPMPVYPALTKPVETAQPKATPEIKPPSLPPIYAFRAPEPPRVPPVTVSAASSAPGYASKPETAEARMRETSQETPAAKDPHLEITLGAWWATRLGIGFLVVALVFFGVYMNIHANPWVRLLEVLAVAGAVTGLGRWLERQTPVYGQVVYAGGLAMFYFAAYGAYAVPALQVVTNVAVGLALQFAAVAALTTVAWVRNRSQVATMAVFLGELSCVFALRNEHLAVTLGAAFGLAAVGAFLRVARSWAWPMALGYAGAQLCYVAAVLAATGHLLNFMAVAARVHIDYGIWPGITLAYPTALFVLMVAGDVWAQMLKRAGDEAAREMAIRVAAVAYGLGGWWGGNAMGGGWVTWNVLTAAGACLAAGEIYRRRKDLASLYEMLYAAAGAWVAVYLILEYAGWVRWSALLAEAFVFVGWARRKEAMMAGTGVLAAWGLSGLWAIYAAMHLGPANSMVSPDRLVFFIWPLASVGLWGWWSHSPRDLAAWELNAQTVGRVGTALGAVALGGLAWENPARPWLFLGLAVATTALGMVLRERSGVMTALAAWVMSGIWAAVAATHLTAADAMWSGQRLVYFLWPLVSLGLWAWWGRNPRELDDEGSGLFSIGRVLTAFGAVVLGWFAWEGSAQPWLFMGLAVAAVALGKVLRERSGAMTAGAALLAALWTYGQFDGSGASESWLGLAVLTLLVVAGTGWWQHGAAEEERAWPTAGEMVYFVSLLAAWWAGLYDMHLVAVGYQSLVLTGAACGLAAMAWRGPWRCAGDLAWVWAMVGLAAGHSLFVDRPLEVWPKLISDTPWLCLGLSLALGWAWGALARREKPGVCWLRLENAGMFLPAILLVCWTLEILPMGMTESTCALVLAGAATAYAIVARREWLPSGAVTAMVLLALGWWKTVQLKPESPEECVTPVVVAALMLGIGWLAWRRLRQVEAVTLKWLLGFGAVAALVVIDAPTLHLPESAGNGATTAFWAVAGALVFAAGLAGRLRPYRYVGLGGLALCVPRLFVVDITDTLGRIIAFGALAVVLLAIGFSYEKLKTWLVGDDEKPEAGAKPPDG